MTFPKTGCQKLVLVLLRAHIPFSALGLKTDSGICFPWEGSWHKCCAGLAAAFGVSQGEVISVNNDLNFQHQYSVIVKWLNDTPQAIAVGRMRMKGRRLGRSQQGRQADHTSRLGGVVLTCTSDGHTPLPGTPALWEKLVYMS